MTKQTYISTNCQPYQSFQVASLPTSQLGWVPFVFTSKQIHPFQMVTHFFPLGCPYQIWISIPKLGPSMVPWRSRQGTGDGLTNSICLKHTSVFQQEYLVFQQEYLQHTSFSFKYSFLVLKENIKNYNKTEQRSRATAIFIIISLHVTQLQHASLSEASDSSSRKMWTLEMS